MTSAALTRTLRTAVFLGMISSSAKEEEPPARDNPSEGVRVTTGDLSRMPLRFWKESAISFSWPGWRGEAMSLREMRTIGAGAASGVVSGTLWGAS